MLIQHSSSRIRAISPSPFGPPLLRRPFRWTLPRQHRRHIRRYLERPNYEHVLRLPRHCTIRRRWNGTSCRRIPSSSNEWLAMDTVLLSYPVRSGHALWYRHERVVPARDPSSSREETGPCFAAGSAIVWLHHWPDGSPHCPGPDYRSLHRPSIRDDYVHSRFQLCCGDAVHHHCTRGSRQRASSRTRLLNYSSRTCVHDCLGWRRTRRACRDYDGSSRDGDAFEAICAVLRDDRVPPHTINDRHALRHRVTLLDW